MDGLLRTSHRRQARGRCARQHGPHPPVSRHRFVPREVDVRVQNVGQRNCAGLVGRSERSRARVSEVTSPCNSSRRTCVCASSINAFSTSSVALKAACRYRQGLRHTRRAIARLRLRPFQNRKAAIAALRSRWLERFPVEKSASAGAVETKRAGKRNLR